MTGHSSFPSHFVGGEFEKKSGIVKNCGRWSDIIDEIFPDIVLLISGFSKLQKILSIRVSLFLDILLGKRIWSCNELEFRSYRKVMSCSDVSKFNRSMLKSPRRTIILSALSERLSSKRLR